MTPVRRALNPSSTLRDVVREGLGAVEKAHIKLIDDSIRAAFVDSLDIDAGFVAQYPNDPRWDYLLGHDASGQVVGLDPHSAKTGEISTVKAKRAHARAQLRDHMKPGATVAEWFWVASGKVDFLDQEKATLQLAQAGVKFIGRRVLQRHLASLSTTRTAKKKT